ncbi:L,D-transpeptidase family protein [Streptomyces sp. BV129]|uniref:L,D-transpeptidase family protein n=1 Tax=Streptomyces sp. BV129 TaxID=2849671 RepID=UPI001C2ED86B|nr:L,D-transpeptidase family protein [Streptomyces sp. BV129]MBV1949579.1 L,D-transpeptidase family protein [Streptomyces sp. BV129]
MRNSTDTPSCPRYARRGGARHAISAAAVCGVLLAVATSCGDTDGRARSGGAAGNGNPAVSGSSSPATGTGVPGVGARMGEQIPSATRQLVVVYGDDRDSAEGLAVLYEKQGAQWKQSASWPSHNGRRGWTTDHQLDDERSPVGVFTLTDAGGTLRSPGSKLPYWYDDNAYAASVNQDDEAHAHDFDYVIAINYNRLKGTPPYDWSRPEGVEKGGGIWLHLDHGDGTSACVTVPETGMKTLLRTLDPADHPVVIMGDRERLKS